MLEEYYQAIEKLENRRDEIFAMIYNHIGCKQDLMRRIFLIDEELSDLYDIVRHLKLSLYGSRIFLD